MIQSEVKIFNEINRIHKIIKSKDWNCIYDNCKNNSINSHLLQENGILNNISEKNHFMKFSMNESFERNKKGQFSFNKISINKGLSFPLFCNLHDTNLFKNIEQNEYDIFSYEAQLLFSYRAICAELRQKEIVIETEKAMLNSEIIKSVISKKGIRETQDYINGLSFGIKDLLYFKAEFENNRIDLSLNNFHFETFRFHKLDVCASATFSPFKNSFFRNLFSKFIYRNKPFESIIINLVPQNEHLYIIVGYHKNHVTEYMKKYIQKFNTENKIEQQLIVSNLFATRINTWALSISTYNAILEKNKIKFTQYWEENYTNIFENQHFSVNIFE